MYFPPAVNQHVSIIRVKQDVADPGYVLSYLTHCDQDLYRIVQRRAGQDAQITKGHIESFRIALPPLMEQRAIAHILDTLDDRIDLNRRMNETLEGMARALFSRGLLTSIPVRAKKRGSRTSVCQNDSPTCSL